MDQRKKNLRKIKCAFFVFQRILIVLAVFSTSVIVIYFTVIIPGEIFVFFLNLSYGVFNLLLS